MNDFKNDLREFVRRHGRSFQSKQIPDICKNAVLNCLDLTEPQQQRPVKLKPLSVSVSDQLIQDILSGSFSPQKARAFLDHILFDAGFVDHLQHVFEDIRFETVTNRVNDADLTCSVPMAPDNTLLQHIVNIVHTRSTPNNRQGPRSIKRLWFGCAAHCRPAAGGLTLAAAAVAIFLLVMRPDPEDKLFKSYFTDSRPYYSSVQSFRSSDSVEKSKTAEAFRSGFARYLTGDYEMALEDFSRAAEFDENASLQRSVYFYSALSCLALYKQEKNKSYIENAVTFIHKAEQIAGNDRDELYFFKGFIYSIASQKEKAIKAFQMISEKSRFYKDSAIMLESLK